MHRERYFIFVVSIQPCMISVQTPTYRLCHTEPHAGLYKFTKYLHIDAQVSLAKASVNLASYVILFRRVLFS